MDKEYTIKLKGSEVIKLHFAIMKFICGETTCERCILNLDKKHKCIPNKMIKQSQEELEQEIIRRAE